jgi:hypothetical protein
MAASMKSSLLLTLAAALVTGCSTIRFDSGKPASTAVKHSEWHHTVAFTLLEASDPVDMHDRCIGKPWSTIKTERTFLNGLAGSVDSLILGVDLWEPLTVEYVCVE